jgi:hypothetical protein
MRGARVLLAVLVASALYSQTPYPPFEPGPKNIGLFLRSSNPKEVAWAAWLAGKHPEGGGQFTPALRQALGRTTAEDGVDQRKLQALLLHALIRSGAGVPMEELASLYEGFPDEVVALAVAGYSHNQDAVFSTLLKAEAKHNRVHWLALLSLLNDNGEAEALPPRARSV